MFSLNVSIIEVALNRSLTFLSNATNRTNYIVFPLQIAKKGHCIIREPRELNILIVWKFQLLNVWQCRKTRIILQFLDIWIHFKFVFH